MGYGLANTLVFKKVSSLLGLDRCVIRLSGAAPITKETLEYFLALNLPICEAFGMSESSGEIEWTMLDRSQHIGLPTCEVCA